VTNCRMSCSVIVRRPCCSGRRVKLFKVYLSYDFLFFKLVDRFSAHAEPVAKDCLVMFADSGGGKRNDAGVTENLTEYRHVHFAAVGARFP